jgi:hypothetical protein
MRLQFSRQNFGKRWMVEPIGQREWGAWVAISAPQADSAVSGSYQDATATKLGSLGAGISAAQSSCLASDWLPRVGVGIRINWQLSHNCLGSGVRSHQYLAA